MNTKLKKDLYESIMKNVAKTVKKQLNESETVDVYKTRMTNYIDNWFETAFHTGNKDRDDLLKSLVLECTAKFNPKVKECISGKFYEYRPYSERVKTLKTYFDSLPIQTRLKIIEIGCKIAKVNCHLGVSIDKFDYSKASNEGQDTIVSARDIRFLDSILDSADFKKAAKMTSIRTFGKMVSQPRFLGNENDCVAILKGLVNKIKEINND